jgi:hypothetical protein
MASNNRVGNQITGAVNILQGDLVMTADSSNSSAEAQNSASTPSTAQRKEFAATLRKRHISTYKSTYLPWNKRTPLITEDIYIPIEPIEAESRDQIDSELSFLQGEVHHQGDNVKQ